MRNTAQKMGLPTLGDMRKSLFNLINDVYDAEWEHCLETLQGETFSNISTATDDRLN